jgi:hypothetical protein
MHFAATEHIICASTKDTAEEWKRKKSLQSNSSRMWLASASLHCEMQLNSPGAINGLLIQTRPGGGAAPSPTGSGALVALPFAVAFFVLTTGLQKEEKEAQSMSSLATGIV